MRVPFNEIDEAFVNGRDSQSPFSNEFEFHLRGRVDEVKLRRAILAAVHTHPMAAARQAPWRPLDRQYNWEITSHAEVDPLRVIELGRGDLELLRDELQSIDVPLDRSPPFRMWLVRQESGDVLVLNASHTAMDGVGCMRLLRSIACEIEGMPDAAPLADPIHAKSLRPLFADPWSAEWRRRFRVLHDTNVQAFFSPPVHLARVGGSEHPGYGVHHLSIAAGVIADIKRRHAASAMTNDVLLAALTLAIEAWNRAHHGPEGRICLMMPLNLRPPSFAHDVVGNFSFAAYVSTEPHQRSEGKQLLGCIVEQTRRIKQNRAAAALVDAYRFASLAPLIWKRMLPPLFRLSFERFVPTAALTNLGRVADSFSFGSGAPADELWVSPPCRMPMGLGVGVFEHRGALRLSLRYQHPQLGKTAARAFAQLLADSLRRLA